MPQNTDKSSTAPLPPEATRSESQFTENMLKLAEQSQQFMLHWFQHMPMDSSRLLTEQMHIGAAFMEMYAKAMEKPETMMQTGLQFWQDYVNLLTSTTQKWLGQDASPIIQPDSKDRRFRDDAWNEHAAFDFLKQFYLLASKRINEAVQHVEGLDNKTARKVAFYTQQFIDALSPTNFLLTNPAALRETIESEGENLVRGMENLLTDIQTGRIAMADVKAFSVGENIACTPGCVVYQNDLMQLIHYTPTTETVHEVPVLVIPAWINKFYILDLQPDNSYVKWLVDHGYSVFMVSWVNPDSCHAHKHFDDYLKEGPLAALDAIEKATGSKKVSAVGYCLGGTLLTITLAWLAAKGQADRITSATFFTTMTDFSEAGDLSIFIDDEQLENLESRMSEKGYLDAKDMALTFNMLRSNDLIWHFVVNNYLLGKSPFPFDLLYWNADATRMPARMHSFYLRNMYQKNLLVKKNALTINGVTIDLHRIQTPCFFLSTKEDHIAPWDSTYKGTQLLQGPVEFVLADSGHVAGVISAPGKTKYGYRTNQTLTPKAEDWLQTATHHNGSWWPYWDSWNQAHTGKHVPAYQPGKGKLKPLEPAPGSYVKVKA